MSPSREGPLHRFFAADHRRLDRELKASLVHAGRIEPVPFEAFRAGILRRYNRTRCLGSSMS